VSCIIPILIVACPVYLKYSVTIDNSFPFEIICTLNYTEVACLGHIVFATMTA
jgi:hypothetical protein